MNYIENETLTKESLSDCKILFIMCSILTIIQLSTQQQYAKSKPCQGIRITNVNKLTCMYAVNL